MISIDNKQINVNMNINHW